MHSISQFQRDCYQLLCQIPRGKITTYKAIAEALGTQAYQAVGRAMHQNPNPIVVPCHRVVNANGDIGGYAFGVSKKQALLESEGLAIQNGRVIDFESRLYQFQSLGASLSGKQSFKPAKVFIKDC